MIQLNKGTDHGWRESSHSFSLADDYDPDKMGRAVCA